MVVDFSIRQAQDPEPVEGHIDDSEVAKAESRASVWKPTPTGGMCLAKGSKDTKECTVFPSYPLYPLRDTIRNSGGMEIMNSRNWAPPMYTEISLIPDDRISEILVWLSG